MTEAEAVEFLIKAWGENGVLGKIRNRCFVSAEGEQFLNQLSAFVPDDSPKMSRELARLLWFIPTFVAWQVESLEFDGKPFAEIDAVRKFGDNVLNLLTDILGWP